MRFPNQHLSVAALCNLGSIGPGLLVRQVADVVIGSAFTLPRPDTRVPAGNGASADTPPAKTASIPARLEDYAGGYHSDEIDATFTVSVRENALWLQRDAGGEPGRLAGSSPDVFRAFDMTVTFERAAAGVVALVVDAGRVRGIRFDRLDRKGSRP